MNNTINISILGHPGQGRAFTLDRKKQEEPYVLIVEQRGDGVTRFVEKEICSASFNEAEKWIFLIVVLGEHSVYVRELGGTVINPADITVSEKLLKNPFIVYRTTGERYHLK